MPQSPANRIRPAAAALGTLFLLLNASPALLAQASLQANPNPIFVSDGSGLGATTLFYTSPASVPIAIYAGGTLFCAPAPGSGSCPTGTWVSNGLTFELREAFTGTVLASVTVQVINTNLSCSGMNPSFVGPVSPSTALQFSVLGVANATAVHYLVQPENTPLSSSPSQPAVNVGGGTWSAGVSTALPLGGYKVTARLTAANGQQVFCKYPAFFTVATNPNPDPSYSCGSIAGEWKDNLTHPVPGTWNLTQAATSSVAPVPVTGTYRTSPVGNCPEVTWTASGTINTASGQYALTATNPNPPSSANCEKNNLQEAGNIQTILCDVGTGPFAIVRNGTTINSGTYTMRRQGPVPVPSGDSSAFTSWNSTGYSTWGGFAGTITLPQGSPSGFSFAGRAVGETDGPGGASDGCWFSGSAVTQLTGLTGGAWYVNRSNSYATDYIGYAPSGVGYYQAYRSLAGLPTNCTVSIPQQMVISSGALQNVPYGAVNTLTIQIKPSSVAVSRATASAERPFGF